MQLKINREDIVPVIKFDGTRECADLIENTFVFNTRTDKDTYIKMDQLKDSNEWILITQRGYGEDYRHISTGQCVQGDSWGGSVVHDNGVYYVKDLRVCHPEDHGEHWVTLDDSFNQYLVEEDNDDE